MSKIDLDPITSGYNLSKINSNFQKVEDTLNQEVLYRKNYVGEPNEMRTNLDMNGNKILNVTTGTSDGSLVTKGYVDQGLALKFDKSGGPLSGPIDMGNNEILNTSRLSTDTLEIGGVQVVPTNLAIDPYNGTREALRRSYAEAGYNLVAGSFEAGGTLVNANDVLLQERTGKVFSGPAGTVAAGTVPSGPNYINRGDETLRSDLANLDKGAAIVSYRGKSVAEALDGAVNGYSVESFRSPGLSDSNVIRAAIDWIRNNRERKPTRLLFEHGRKYTIDRTIEMGDVANLTIDINGATLFRAPWTATTSSLAESAPVSSTTIKLDVIPDNWEVSDIIMPYTGTGGREGTGNMAHIVAIDRETNTVTLRGAIGAAGSQTSVLPVGTKIGKQIITFNGEYNVISENVKIINGTFDGNRANQRNMFWRYSLEVLLYGRNSEVSGCVFKNTQGECISGHGIRVSNNEFQDLNGSCFHTSLHDDIAATSGGSWFVGNSVKNVCLAGQAVNGHSEGAVTFSFGAGNLVVSGNQFDTGYTGVLGEFGPSTAEHPDKWLIVTDNICKNFGSVFYGVYSPVFGVVVANNIFIKCGASRTSLRTLGDNPLSQIVGNIFADDEAGTIAQSSYSKLRIDNVTIGNITQKTGLAWLVIGDGVPDRNLESAPYGNPGVLLAGNNSNIVSVTNANGWATHEYYEPTGFSTFTVAMDNSSYSYRLVGNRPNAKVSIEKARLKLATEPAWTPIFADNAAAVAGGLPAGTVYRTSDGTLKAVY